MGRGAAVDQAVGMTISTGRTHQLVHPERARGGRPRSAAVARAHAVRIRARRARAVAARAAVLRCAVPVDPSWHGG